MVWIAAAFAADMSWRCAEAPEVPEDVLEWTDAWGSAAWAAWYLADDWYDESCVTCTSDDDSTQVSCEAVACVTSAGAVIDYRYDYTYEHWGTYDTQEITEESLARVFAAKGVDLFMLGTGTQPWLMPEALRWRFRDARIGVEVTPTGPAVRTYNILFAERRRVGAALIAVD